jgi:hypothetical protein
MIAVILIKNYAYKCIVSGGRGLVLNPLQI